MGEMDCCLFFLKGVGTSTLSLSFSSFLTSPTAPFHLTLVNDIHPSALSLPYVSMPIKSHILALPCPLGSQLLAICTLPLLFPLSFLSLPLPLLPLSDRP